MPRKRKAAKDPKETLDAFSAWIKDLFTRTGGYDKQKAAQAYRKAIVRFYKRFVLPKGTTIRSTMVKTRHGNYRIMLTAKLKDPWVYYDFTLSLEQEDKQ